MRVLHSLTCFFLLVHTFFSLHFSELCMCRSFDSLWQAFSELVLSWCLCATSSVWPLLTLSTTSSLRRCKIVKLLFFIAAFSLRDLLCKNDGEMAGPVGHFSGCKLRQPFGCDESIVPKKWIRVSTGEEPRDDFFRSPGQPHRFRPRRQSPDANLDHSSNATEAAYDMRDDYTDHRIHQACSSDLWDFIARCHQCHNQGALLPTMMLGTLHLRGTGRGGTQVGPTTTWAAQASHDSLAGVGKCGQLAGTRSVADTKRPSCPRSWQLGVGGEEPPLPPPRLASPCPERGCEPPPPHRLRR